MSSPKVIMEHEELLRTCREAIITEAHMHYKLAIYPACAKLSHITKHHENMKPIL